MMAGREKISGAKTGGSAEGDVTEAALGQRP